VPVFAWCASAHARGAVLAAIVLLLPLGVAVGLASGFDLEPVPALAIGVGAALPGPDRSRLPSGARVGHVS
jgi:hypothetical protein